MAGRRSIRDARMVDLGSRALEALERRSLLPNLSKYSGGEWGIEKLREALQCLESDDHQEDRKNKNREEGIGVCTALLQHCGNLKALAEGKRAHAILSRIGADREAPTANLVMQMYGKCGCPDEARLAFEKIQVPNVFSWTILLTAYAQKGHLQEAQRLFSRIPSPGVVARTIMVTAYARSGDLIHARKIFDEMPQRTVVSWNALLTAYAQKGHHHHRKQALELFSRMDQEGFQPNIITFVSVLEACGAPQLLENGRAIHREIVESDLSGNLILSTAVVNMYANCGRAGNARRVFDSIPDPNPVAWSSIVRAYARNGESKLAVEMFSLSDLEGASMCDVALICVVDACASLGDLAQAQIVHRSISISKWASDIKVKNALVNMYSKCGSLEHTKAVFDSMENRNVISWSALITAHAQSRDPDQTKRAFELFQLMDLEGVVPNEITYVAVLDACSKLHSAAMGLCQGRLVHASCVEAGCHVDVVVATALVNMYAKCGKVAAAMGVFSAASSGHVDVVLRNAMLTALVHNGHVDRAITMFYLNTLEGHFPTRITFIEVLSACAQAGLVKDGVRIFLSLEDDYGIVPGMYHYECMVDLFGRAGLLGAAEDLMNHMPFEPEPSAWLSLLSACKSNSDPKRADRVAQNVVGTDPSNAAPFVILANVLKIDEQQASGFFLDPKNVGANV